MTWQVHPTMLTCLLTGRCHGMPTVLDDVMLTSWWHHPYSGLALGSGQLVFRSGQPIRVKKTRVTRGARGQPPLWRVTTRVVVADVRFQSGVYQWLRLFLLYTVVWSKHNFDNFYFWAKINTTLNHVLWYQLMGISTGDVLIVAHWRLSTLTQYLMWFCKSPTSTGEVHFIRDRERIQ